MFVHVFMSLPITIVIGPSPGGHRTVASGLSDLTELASEAASLTRVTVPCLLASHPPCGRLSFRSSSVPCLGPRPGREGGVPTGRAFVSAIPLGSGWREGLGWS